MHHTTESDFNGPGDSDIDAYFRDLEVKADAFLQARARDHQHELEASIWVTQLLGKIARNPDLHDMRA